MSEASNTAKPGIKRLTQAQERHLSEMIGHHGKLLYWTPWGSAQRSCAAALQRKGLLTSHYLAFRGPQYELTEEGVEIARALSKKFRRSQTA